MYLHYCRAAADTELEAIFAGMKKMLHILGIISLILLALFLVMVLIIGSGNPADIDF